MSSSGYHDFPVTRSLQNSVDGETKLSKRARARRSTDLRVFREIDEVVTTELRTTFFPKSPQITMRKRALALSQLFPPWKPPQPRSVQCRRRSRKARCHQNSQQTNRPYPSFWAVEVTISTGSQIFFPATYAFCRRLRRGRSIREEIAPRKALIPILLGSWWCAL